MTERNSDVEIIHVSITEAIDNLMAVRKRIIDAKSLDANNLLQLRHNVRGTLAYSEDALYYAEKLSGEKNGK